jgi:hypothetical protein
MRSLDAVVGRATGVIETSRVARRAIAPPWRNIVAGQAAMYGTTS